MAPEPDPSADAVVRALADPATYGGRIPVEHVQTHISHVFLVGPWVYKLKKPVTFPFLDFGTVEKRRHFCEEEVRLNRRLAPGVYVDVLPVTMEQDGRIRLGGDGRVLDHVVRMRRLPSARLLPALLGTGAANGDFMDALAARLVEFHAEAPSGADVAAHAAPERLAAGWEDILDGVSGFAGRLLSPEDLDILIDFGPRFVRTHETLLRARQEAGRIREGHGDLHAEHVCFLAEPTSEGLAAGIYVFDCIEFSRALRCTDVAAEIAFLSMDVERRGHPALAERFASAYARGADDPDVLLLLPFYVCARACVRGKVEGLKADESEVDPAEREAAGERARAFFRLALRHAWQAAAPAVIACAGLSGCGKSTLAQILADATGFTLLSSDVLRKRGMAGAATGETLAPYGAGLYTPAARSATYAALCKDAEAEVVAGRGVIADATWMRREDRRRLEAVARACRRPLVFVECRADEPTIRARLEARVRAPSVSDARWETYLSQRQAWELFGEDEPHLSVDTGGSAPDARAAALRGLWPWIHGHPLATAAQRGSRDAGLACRDST